ncbi:MAG: DUF4124 domain-containing protein [Burkholderiales bacterium]|nr:DUF4124 domain-containing protein [Burkholderiales bacterium]
MKRPSLIAASLLCLVGATTHAQTFKCTTADGKVTYSNVACPDSTQSVRPVDTSGNTLDGSSLREKVQKDKADAAQSEAKEREQAAAEADQRRQAQTRAADTTAQDSAAYGNCTRDVERQGVTEDVKAELYAACRTAGGNQRRSGMGEGTIRECVRSVERTGTHATDRARKVATCHGADVKPEPPVVVLRPTARTMGPPRITTCSGNQCSDDAGQRYFKQQGTGLVREDGKHCQQAAGNTVHCP